MPFETDWTKVDDQMPCRHCGTVGRIERRLWESDDGGHEDVKYRCLACERTWWVDGPDA